MTSSNDRDRTPGAMESTGELERAWEEGGQHRYGDWPTVQDRVRFGYDGL